MNKREELVFDLSQLTYADLDHDEVIEELECMTMTELEEKHSLMFGECNAIT